MRSLFFIFCLMLMLPPASIAEEDSNTPKVTQKSCKSGTTTMLKIFFSDESLIQIASGKRTRKSGFIGDQPDVLFLLSKDMDFFHVVTLKPIENDQFEACIFTSAREIDFQIASPIPNLLDRKNREHLLFLNDVPKNGECPPERTICKPFSGPSEFAIKKFLLTGYMYSELWELDAYQEIVDLTVDNKVIHPTRGALSELARTKYSSRLRNELEETDTDRKAAKDVYRNIYQEVDHGHPLFTFVLGENKTWEIVLLDRQRGVVWQPIHGTDLQIYPLSKREYEQFLTTEN